MFHGKPRALFLFPSKRTYLQEVDICGGLQIADFGGEACPFSLSGRMAQPPHSRTKTASKTQLALEIPHLPTCVTQKLGSLSDWGRETNVAVPEHVADLPVYKCRQMFLLVIIQSTDRFDFGG